ncbi:Pr6Pr family membrane protein [Pedococcus dokdonensis]|uniref:Pr6Pr family membrane protein n=1 Tax=Pedococcus dokdonensis TaxID=443156 RepID=UPI0012FE5737|nr:Pr6Pr family membrane protein [Pedococcus dokdonensis]
MRPTSARAVHLVVAVVALAALVLQLVLVVRGGRVLDETAVPPLSTRLVRFFSYFTVLSNLLVAVTSTLSATDPERDGERWRVAHTASMVGITITGLVHWFLLRPLLDLHGADALADKLLHVVVPLLAVVAWVVVGPRRRTSSRSVALSLLWPVAWTVYTLARGAVVDWYPYPFLDVGELGWGRVLVNMVGIAVLFALVGLALVGADRVLGRRSTRST